MDALQVWQSTRQCLDYTRKLIRETIQVGRVEMIGRCRVHLDVDVCERLWNEPLD
jgi:hypothetical protein